MLDRNRITQIATDVASKVDIVDIVGSYISLKRKGKDYWAICPFHNDKHPSLSVTQEKQIFTCWSCHATGGVFKFVQDMEHIQFIPAIKRVCEIAGIPVPSELETNVPTFVNKYQRLNDLLNLLAKYYTLQLSTQEGIEAKNYLNSRNLDNNDISTFKIGFAPADGYKAIEYLKSKGYTEDEIISAGVASAQSDNHLIDRLRGRVVFSLMDNKGNVVGFSGRRIKEDDSAKYLNTQETVLFHKSNNLYNYKNAFDNAKCGYTYVVEGFMDAIAMHKAGFKSVVATMGTAFTNDHIKLLKNLKSELRLLFDADDPGQDATFRTLSLLSSHNFKVKVVKPLDNYKDIDEALNKAGAEKVNELVNNLREPLEWQLSYLSKNINFTNFDEAKKYATDCIDLLSGLAIDELDKEHYLNLVSQKTGISLALLNKQLNQKVANNESSIREDFFDIHSYEEVKQTLTKYEQASHQILLKMIENPLNIVKYNQLGISLCDKGCRQLAALIVDTFNKGIQVTYSNLLLEATGDMIKVIAQLQNEQYPENELEDLAKILTEDYSDKLTLDELKIQLENEVDLKKKQEIARQILELKKKRGN